MLSNLRTWQKNSRNPNGVSIGISIGTWFKVHILFVSPVFLPVICDVQQVLGTPPKHEGLYYKVELEEP